MGRITIFSTGLMALFFSCKSSLNLSKDGEVSSDRRVAVPATVEEKAVKLMSDDCIDPDLALVSVATKLMLCDGSIASGTYTLADCSSDGEIGCVTVAAYKAAKMSNFTGAEIKDGITIAGVEGAIDDCIDDGSNCFLPSYSQGTQDKKAVDLSAIDFWDVRYGMPIGGVTGKLKVNCRNMVNLASYDAGFCSPALYSTKADCDANGGTWIGDGNGTSGVVEITDTVDDHANNGSFPSENPWGSDEYFCGFNDPAEATWELVDEASAPDGDAIYRDRISGLKWTRGDVPATTATWLGSIAYCSGLTHGSGGDTWRLPTQKELMAAYEHGINDLDDGHTGSNNLSDLDTTFWTSSTDSSGISNAWFMSLFSGGTSSVGKGDSHSVLCVSP